MDINEFLAIGIVGVLLSGVIEFLQARYGTSGLKTKFMSIGLALAVGTAYVLFRETDWWMTVLGVLGAASTTYALLLKDALSTHE